jgi:REP element-mobilizing transposase RayT
LYIYLYLSLFFSMKFIKKLLDPFGGLGSLLRMRRARWTISPVPEGVEAAAKARPVIYHCVSRVVDQHFAFGQDEKEKLRIFMRMYENFSGNRVLAYCFMCNHIHLLVEITAMPAGGLSDEELLGRLKWIQTEAQVAAVAKELAEARRIEAEGRAKDGEAYVMAIHERFTWRMHDLSQFMQGFLQRYTLWHNRKTQRQGHLWEDRFKSVIVEDGMAAKTMAAYIDLNPVRAGMVKNPEEYRWSSYGEAIGGRVKGDCLTRLGSKGNGKKARAGLVRAMRAHKGVAADAAFWRNDVALEYRKILLAGAGERVEERVEQSGAMKRIVKRRGLTKDQLDAEKQRLLEAEEQRMVEIPFGRMLRCRVRYFTDGAVLGSREFVNAAFESARERFGPKRKTGARRLRGHAGAAAGMLWSMRDLQRP